MAHNYLFALTDAGGTVPPELGVARRLINHGHRVRILAEDTMAHDVTATGADFKPWITAPNRPDHSLKHITYRDWETTNPLALARGMADHMLAGPASRQAHDVTTAITQEHPDLIIASFTTFGAMITAQAHKLPFDVLIPNIYPMPAPKMPPMGMGLPPHTGPLAKTRNTLINTISTRLLGRYALNPLNTARHTHGLPPLKHIWDQVHAARRELILTSAAFDFPAQLPTNARYVGPILDDPDWATTPDWQPPPGDTPLVLIAMSSTFQNHHNTLQTTLDALNGLPIRGLLTTGPAIDPTTLNPPPNTLVTTSAPHHHVMKKAALVITHGGHGTVIKALAADLPLLVMPHGRDQPDNAVRVVQRGAGLSVPRSASPSRIRRSVTRLLEDPTYTSAAARLGAEIRRDAASGTLLKELETLAP